MQFLTAASWKEVSPNSWRWRTNGCHIICHELVSNSNRVISF